MDCIPLEFCETVTRLLYYATCKEAQYLSGAFGIFAGSRCQRLFTIKDGILVDEKTNLVSDDPSSVKRKKVFYIEVNVVNCSIGELNTAILNRISGAYQRHAIYELSLLGSMTITERDLKMVSSWKDLRVLGIYHSILEGPLQSLFKEIVQKGELYKLCLCCPSYTVEGVEIIKKLFCQKQFKTLFLFDSLLLERILRFWTTHRREFSGKEIDIINEDLSALFAGKLELCLVEETQSFEKVSWIAF
ncbi:hypothetical protein QR680_004566 [Steinernema hermaphroditum]|uniref:Uncharacterized protein n=1 Tax=Steinernema hermaphroditum TaxID=289476 RepID=A0AA39HRE4_9BILA|nr:hypothetical protein QR680_004566 [Steinernema hermaphroditum]